MQGGKNDTPHPRGPTLPYTKSKDKKFISLEDYEEVMDEEIDSLRATIVRLREAVQAVSGSDEPMDEDKLCTICYANESEVEFLPCHHSSCRRCIKQHLMSTRECFFCKTNVENIRSLKDTSDEKKVGGTAVEEAGPSSSR